ncbi:MAG: DUF971 domain-containing protein [Bryobacteraceae bacterium]
MSEPEHIAVSKSKGIKIDWKDGHASDYGLGYLRDECPCATCTGAHGSEPQRTSYSKPDASPFPMFKPALRIASIDAVGNYAVRIVWSDGHSTGIYSWEHFRRICPCAVCTVERDR